MSTAPYWPWWLGAASLAAVTFGSFVASRRPLGVSWILARFASLRGELEVERQRHALAADGAALEAALLAATAEEFGTEPFGPEVPSAEPRGSTAPRGGPDSERGARRAISGPRPPLGAHAVFLAAVVLGGLTVQLSRGSWKATLDMGPTFAALFGTGAGAALALGSGGVLVGIGAAVSGGCTTGHGLSGCSRMQAASLAATLAFLVAAMLVSWLLEGELH